jgi:HD-GYP domain-containing protein (c-di-GMP phosphodiesterase class II)
MLRTIAWASAIGLTSGTAWRERQRRSRAERFAAAALESLLRAIDANDRETGLHVRRTAGYALVIAEAMGLPEDEHYTIEIASLFHDVGKVHQAVLDVVQKPGSLTPAERRAIAQHPIKGAEVLAPIAYFHPSVAKAVLAHHERWDGSGYPRHLKGRRIPLAARVLAIADTFDALTYDRRYRPGGSAGEAAEIILAGRGTQFDPEIVDLVMLPPVLERLEQVRRIAARRSLHPRMRSAGRGYDDKPEIEIRWRSRTPTPATARVPAKASR